MQFAISKYQNKETRCLAATIQQQGIWFHAMAHSAAHWNFIKFQRFHGQLEEQRLLQAIEKLCSRHASLRTNLELRGTTLCQVISDEVDPYVFFRWRHYPASTDLEQLVRKRIAEMLAIELDLSRDVLFRFEVISCGADHYFLLLLHHSIADGLSLQIIWKDLADSYNDPDAPDTEVHQRQYEAFFSDQQKFLQSAKYLESRSYWLNKLDALPPPIPLPFFSVAEKTSIHHSDIAVPEELTLQLRSFALSNRVYFSSLLISAYQLLIYKYSGQSKMVIGNVVSGRGFGTNRYKGIVGHFANRLPHLLDLDNELPFAVFLRNVQQEVSRSFDYGELPYEEMIRQLGETRKNGIPLFNAAFNLIKETSAAPDFNGLVPDSTTSFAESHKYDSQYDIYLCVLDGATSMKCKLALRCSEPWMPVIDFMLQSYLSLLQHCILYPDRPLKDIPLVCPAEKALLKKINSTSTHGQKQTLVSDLFCRQASLLAQHPALRFDGNCFSYEQLSYRVSSIMGGLRSTGVKKGDRIGILMKRSQGIIEVMLAALKTGAVYVPLDPAYPAQRLEYICEDAALHFVVSDDPDHNGLSVAARKLSYPVLLSSAVPATQDATAFGKDGDALAYILYTSGSTGRPKGVMIGHQALANFTTFMTDFLPFSGSRVYSLTTFCFDIFFLESIVALCGGAEVVVSTADEQMNPLLSIQKIKTSKADILQVTPSRLRLMLDADNGFLSSLQVLIVGGEPFPEDLFVRIRKHYHGKLINMYGPTETTIWSTVKELPLSGAVTAGVPLANTEVYVLDGEKNVSGIGMYGEVVIGGSGLALGYWNQPEKTSMQFIHHAALGKLLYRTGDIGRWHPAGELEISGREDDQIKLHGYRIETGEIEYWLQQVQGVKKAVVICRRGPRSHSLHAFFQSTEPILGKELRKFLKQHLPDYMIPDTFRWMSAFPLTPNGKTDKLMLHEALADEEVQEKEDAAVNLSEDSLVRLWNNILESDSGDTDDFFDAGGHSLKALYLLEVIENRYGVKIAVRDFFKNPTLTYLHETLDGVPASR